MNSSCKSWTNHDAIDGFLLQSRGTKIIKPILTYVDHRWIPSRGYIAVARILTGAILILAGTGKLPERMQFVDVVIKYHVLPYPIAFVYGVILPWLEIGIGLALALGIYIRLAALISLPVIFSFIVANGISLSKGKVVCTSCFGEIILAVPTPAALVADLILLGVVLSLLWIEPESSVLKKKAK